MIDELQLQKWVDGELSNDQIRNLLRDVDQADHTGTSNQSSSAWKQVAVAFAENQIVQRQFTDLDSRLNAVGGDSLSTSDTIADNPRLNRPDGTNARPNTAIGWWMVALAASLLLCFSLIPSPFGGSIHPEVAPTVASQDSPDSQTKNVDQLEVDQREVDQLPNFDHRTLLTLAPDRHLQSAQLPASHSTKVSQQVPLYDAKRFDRRQLVGLRNNDVAARRAWVNQVMPTSGVSDQMVADYEKAGLMVNQDIEFLSGRLDDGRSYMIPYRTVRFSPGQ